MRFSTLYLFLPHSSHSISHSPYPSHLHFLLKYIPPTTSTIPDEWPPPSLLSLSLPHPPTRPRRCLSSTPPPPRRAFLLSGARLAVGAELGIAAAPRSSGRRRPPPIPPPPSLPGWMAARARGAAGLQRGPVPGGGLAEARRGRAGGWAPRAAVYGGRAQRWAAAPAAPRRFDDAHLHGPDAASAVTAALHLRWK